MISVLMVVTIIMSVMVIIGILKWHRATIEQIQAEIEQAKLRGDVRTIDYCIAFNDGLNDALTIIDEYKEVRTRMKTCNTCIFRGVSLTGNKVWKCKQFGTVKRFNIAWLHGWFCKYFKAESEE